VTRTGSGHDEKNSRRAYLVCIASISGIPKCSWAGPGRATKRHGAHFTARVRYSLEDWSFEVAKYCSLGMVVIAA
jgi:hypothetical protein